MKCLKGFRYFIMSALVFCVFTGLSVAASANANEVTMGDLSQFDEYEVVQSYPVMNSAANDSFSYTVRQGGERGTFVAMVQSKTYKTISGSDGGYYSKYAYDYMEVRVASGSFSMDAGKYYRFTGTLSFSTGLSTVWIPMFADTKDIYVAYKLTPRTDGSWSYLDYDIVYCPKISKTFTQSFYFTIPSKTDYLPTITYTPNAVSMIAEPEPPPPKSIEEWLQDIFNVLKNGVTGEGGQSPTSPELTEDIGAASDHLGKIDQVESSLQTDFEAQYEAIDLDGFKFPVGVLNAMSWIGSTWTSFFDKSGDLQYVVLLPCLVGLSLLVLGRGMVAMRSAMPRQSDKANMHTMEKGSDD